MKFIKRPPTKLKKMFNLKTKNMIGFTIALTLGFVAALCILFREAKKWPKDEKKIRKEDIRIYENRDPAFFDKD